MIILITGGPGNGKTLYALTWMQEFFKGRDIYYSGIKDLMLPWKELDGNPLGPTDWYKVPVGSVVVIDECQRIFRPRTLGGTVPQYVQELETHRHSGFDLVFITQDPMLVDVNIRRLVGMHFHIVRSFGMQKATVHEWASVKEQCGKPAARGDSIKHAFSYPEKNFGLYKSAEVHTHKRRIPMRLVLLFVLPLLIAGAVYGVHRWQSGFAQRTAETMGLQKVSTDSKGTSSPAKPGEKPNPVIALGEYLTARAPRVAGLPQTAPVYDGLTAPTVAPFPAACVKFARKPCKCYSQQGTPLDTPLDLCEAIVAGGYFLDFNTEGKQKDANEKGAQSKTVGGASQPEPAVLNLGLPEVPTSDATRSSNITYARGVAAAPKQPQQPKMPGAQ